ncbi:unnamed protein product [Penicillium olsonii]|nr:unnamed protein product [Penicillium olsonii]
MARCDHPAWLELWQGEVGPLVSHGWRLPQITRDLPDPVEQKPQITFFLGRNTKEKALRSLCYSKYKGPRRKNSFNIRLDNRTLHALHPRLFADCDPTARGIQPVIKDVRRCHQDQIIPVASLSEDHTPQDTIIARLLFMFVDLVCIFADDVGGLNGVRDLLLKWTGMGSASSLPKAIRPRIIVVTTTSPSVTQDVLDEADFLLDIRSTQPEFLRVFSDIRFCYLPSDELSSNARFLSLGADISRQLHDTRFTRLRHKLMFSAAHLGDLFKMATDQICRLPRQKFDFIASTRQQNLLDGAFNSHLVDFLKLSGKATIPYEGIVSHIASAILMDAYPPGMHCFSPRVVFDRLYHEICYQAHREVYSTDELATLQCGRIGSRLTVLFEYMKGASTSSAEIHKDNLTDQAKYWGWLRCNRTCILCLRRSPEHVLPCHHSICDTCVRVFGVATLCYEEEYLIPECPLCRSADSLTVRIKPSTCAARVLSIDGGGPRAVIPLENLEILQGILGDHIPICDMVDLTVGCSSGGLISLSKFMLRMDVGVCKDLFQELAKKVLSPARKKRFLRSWLSDGVYDARDLENALQDHYGQTRRMFDTPQNSLSAGKVAILASEIKAGAPFIFTNYNGAAPHRAQSGLTVHSGLSSYNLRYQHTAGFVRTVKVSHSYGKCELFPTIDIPGLGTFQDGGMRRHNNPINLALSEAKHLWPNCPNPDVFISLGTGSNGEAQSTSVSRFRNIFVDGWLPRIYRSLSSSFEGQCNWREFLGILDDKVRGTYFRFDSPIPGGLPGLNDTDCMEGLSRLVRSTIPTDGSHQDTVTSLLTTSFFLHLDSKPEYIGGLLQCVGSIRCRGSARHIIDCLEKLHPEPKYFYKDSINLGLQLARDDICPSCNRYFRPIRFSIRDINDTISLSLHFGGRTQRLSAFPSSIQWFIEQQRLEWSFGSLDHSFQSQSGCAACEGHQAGRRRKRKYADI